MPGNKLNVNSTLKKKKKKGECKLFPSQTLFGQRLLLCGHSRITTAHEPRSTSPPSLWKRQAALLATVLSGPCTESGIGHLWQRATCVLILQGCQQEGGGCCLVLSTRGFQSVLPARHRLHPVYILDIVCTNYETWFESYQSNAGPSSLAEKAESRRWAVSCGRESRAWSGE